MTHRVIAEINTQALQDNIEVIRRSQPGKKLLAVVKADAYGHGTKHLLSALEGVDGLAVARLHEAISLRDDGYVGRIVLLSGVISSSEQKTAASLDIDLVIHDQSQVDLLMTSNCAYTGSIWLKFDSGMNRLGFKSATQFRSAFHTLAQSFSIDRFIFLTHFASADVTESDFTDVQVSRFLDAIEPLPATEISMSNSAATLRFPKLANDWLRPGLAIYGVDPLGGITQEQLSPVMTLSSIVVAIKEVGAGESVGYGQSWTATKDTRIAVIGVGYGDGYPRSVKTGTRVSINDMYFPIVGRVSMDLMTVEIGDRAVHIGDKVELWGTKVDVADVANNAGTIAWELLLNLTSRVHFDVLQN